ncbi:ABC transporter permease [bacterium]|nr:ABC transporter permease [bacterium]
MLRYIIRRVMSAVPLLFGLLTFTFFIIRLAPGDPVSLYIQGDVDPMFAENLRNALGLNDPLPVQYVKWLKGMVTGELGMSFSKHAMVTDILAATIPNTLLLTAFALMFNFVIGIILGVITALRRGSATDHIVNVTSLFVYSMPEFWLGLMLILGVSLHLDLLPASGMHSAMARFLPPLDYLWDLIQHMILPVFVLGVASAAATGRYMRGSLLEVINQDYIRTARAKGLSELLVIGKHAMRNALIPIITLLGLSLPFLLGGAVIVETVFAWPGMGKLTVDAIFARDYPLIIACTLVSGVMVIVGNLMADILYAMVDPRIRYD